MSYENPALRLEGAHIYVGDRLLLPDVDLTVPRGRHLVLRGPSGSGKSRLIKTLAGFPPPATGQLLVGGRVLSRANRRLLRGEISYVPQLPRLPAGVAVMEYLREPFAYREHRGRRFSETRVEEEADRLRLPSSLLLQRTDQLSGGEAHRVMVLRGLLLEKRIFLLDEVSASLDPESREALLAALGSAASTVVSVSHDERWIEKADDVYELRAARLVSVGGSNGEPS